MAERDTNANNLGVDVADPAFSTADLTAPETVWSTLVNLTHFSIFTAALEMIGMKPFLEQPTCDVTLFAPTNYVFEKFGEDIFEELFDDTESLKDIMLYHVVPITVAYNDLVSTPLTTSQGEEIRVEYTYIYPTLSTKITLDGVADIDVVSQNIRGSATHGAIYMIGQLLVPESFKASAGV
jgi:uncharacterized surface protein with fasciclin (FAS1) repeats